MYTHTERESCSAPSDASSFSFRSTMCPVLRASSRHHAIPWWTQRQKKNFPWYNYAKHATSVDKNLTTKYTDAYSDANARFLRKTSGLTAGTSTATVSGAEKVCENLGPGCVTSHDVISTALWRDESRTRCDRLWLSWWRASVPVTWA